MRSHKIQTILLAIIVLCMSTALSAQVSFNPAYSQCAQHRISVGMDMLYYYGDVYPVVNHPMSVPPRSENVSAGMNVNYIYQVIPQLGLRTTIAGGCLRGSANDQSYQDWIEQGKKPKGGSPAQDEYSIGSFISGFGEVDFGFEWYPIPHREGGLYIYAGVGFHLSAIYCKFANPAHNPIDPTTGTNDPGWRMGMLPVGIGELGYSFRLTNGHTLTVKGSLHNGLINVNSKNSKLGYNLDGWGRGDIGSADFNYSQKDAKYDNTNQSPWGQFTDGYFTCGIAYTFDAGGDNANRLSSYSAGRSKHHNSYSLRVNKRNTRANAYKRKVAKKRNKAFMVGARKR